MNLLPLTIACQRVFCNFYKCIHQLYISSASIFYKVCFFFVTLKAYSWTLTRPNCFCLEPLPVSGRFHRGVTSCWQAPVSRCSRPRCNVGCPTHDARLLASQTASTRLLFPFTWFLSYSVVTSLSSWSLHSSSRVSTTAMPCNDRLCTSGYTSTIAPSSRCSHSLAE